VGTAIVLVGGLLAGAEGAVLAAAAVVASRSAGIRPVGRLATAGLVATLVATLGAALPTESLGRATFVADRTRAGTLGRLTGVLLAAVVVLSALDERQGRRAEVAGPGRRPRGPRRAVAPVVAGATAAVAVAATVGDATWATPVALVAGFGLAGTGAACVVEGPVGARLRAAVERRAHLVQGSAWLVAAFLVQAVTGIAFWAVAARVAPSAEIGQATALFASMQFLNYATALGLQEVVARFTPAVPRAADRILGWSVLATVASSAAGAAVYLQVVDGGAVRALDPLGGVGAWALLAALSAGGAVALLVDTRLMAARRWRWVFGRVVAVSVLRVPLLAVPRPVDRPLWVFLAVAAPIAASGPLGLLGLPRLVGARPRLLPVPKLGVARFAGVSWLANLASAAPQFALPVIVAVHASAQDNANFFVAWSIAAFAFVVPVTIGRVLLAEGSRAEHELEGHARSAARAAAGLVGLGVLASFAAGPLLTALYGDDYEDAGRILPALVLGGVPWALATVAIARARVRHEHGRTVAVTAVLAVGTVGGALLLAPVHGVGGVVVAWLAGTSAAALVAALTSRSRSEPGTERRAP
jgi:O-antigen/teichoic acid export membrane protein